MTTRTITEIVAKMVSVIEGLTPVVAVPDGRRFVYSRSPNRPLRRWLPDAGGAGMLRLFDVDAGGRDDLGANLVAAVQVTHPVTITMAYSAVPKLYGLGERYELQALIAADAQQIKDALRAPTAMAGSGHVCNLVTSIPQLDRSDEKNWFQEIAAAAVFFTGQSG